MRKANKVNNVSISKTKSLKGFCQYLLMIFKNANQANVNSYYKIDGVEKWMEW